MKPELLGCMYLVMPSYGIFGIGVSSGASSASAEEKAVHGEEAFCGAMAIHQHRVWHPGGVLVLAGSSGAEAHVRFSEFKKLDYLCWLLQELTDQRPLRNT